MLPKPLKQNFLGLKIKNTDEMLWNVAVSGDDGRFFQASLEQYVKQLFNLGKERTTPVTGEFNP